MSEAIVVKGNGIGLAGLIISSVGWLTCGLLCIPGVALCVLGMFGDKPKGTAVAGLIIGLPGVLFFSLVGFGLMTAALNVGPAAEQAAERMQQMGDQ